MSTGVHAESATSPPPARVDLAVGGMTCASCAARIEKKLNRLDGVVATVNYATETASVEYDPTTVDTADLIDTIEATGCTAALPQPAKQPDDDRVGPHEHHLDEPDSLRQRLAVSAVLTLPVVV